MPYVLSPIITQELSGLWGEGSPYERTVIYDIRARDLDAPPVHYEGHLLKPHSISHIDAPGHIILNGRTVDSYFKEPSESFYGPARVVRLQGQRWREVKNGGWLWEVTRDELEKALGDEVPDKLLLTVEDCPLEESGHQDPRYALVLSVDAAEMLVSSSSFNAFGTSWKSSDFQPGSRERPVHKILLQQALLFEYLMLAHVPEGEYFFSAFPLPLGGATESPVCPVLYERKELAAFAEALSRMS